MEKGYLVYCIVTNLGTQSTRGLLGVDGQPVFLIPNNGLTAVVSRINWVDAAPRISQLLEYKKVVESLHRSPAVRGVIPMRYGCMFETKAQIIRLLEKRHSLYTAILKEVEGCVEMGIRVLISDFRSPISDSEKPIRQLETRNSKLANLKSQIANPGKAYLAARKAHYAREEKFNNQVMEVIEQCRASFGGLFVKCKTEVPSIANRLPSLYFLISRVSIAAFHHAFRRLIKSTESASLLLSGPWPPYNFVQPEHTEGVYFRDQGPGTRVKGSGKTHSPL
jgi:hypothetical protein